MACNFERENITTTKTSAKGRPTAERSRTAVPRLRTAMRWTMAAFYLAAGTVHLIAPDQFLPIVPDFVPMPREVVLATGLCEIAGGLALLTNRLRWLAGVLLALYAAFVFPANIKHAFEGVHLPPVPDTWWYHGPRLLMQPVLVWWALFCAGVVDWPLRERSRTF
jgi:uncharacterized membrane protein